MNSGRGGGVMYHQQQMDPNAMYRGGVGPGGGHQQVSGGGGDLMPSCLLVYGLNEEKFGPRKLFNLLCIFGNVNKIKFMKTKAGSALVEMQGQEATQRIMEVLRQIHCFGSELIAKNSKQQEIIERQQDDESKLPNGELYYMNFMGSRDQRFSSPLDRSKNRLQTPKKTLHAYNLPNGIPEEALLKLFEDQGCAVPQEVKFVENKYKEEAKKIGANVVFGSVNEATEALVLANHMIYHDPNSRKFTVKLCYSSGRDTD